MINVFIVLVILSKKFLIINSTHYTTSFSNRMHSPLRTTNICTFHSKLWRHVRSNCTTTSWVIPNNKFLHWYSSLFSKNSYQSSWNTISHVTLVVVCFKNNTCINLRRMSWLMFRSIVRMYSVCHISRDTKRFLHDDIPSFHFC